MAPAPDPADSCGGAEGAIAMTREGGCFCGALRYTVTGEPRNSAHCHCLHCRKTSAAAFVTWSTFPAGAFAWTRGQAASFASRPGVTRTFCSACGTPLTFETRDDPADIDVTTCSLDDPGSITPNDHVFASRMLPWADLKDGLPRFAMSRKNG
jgi:hypothetical protein